MKKSLKIILTVSLLLVIAGWAVNTFSLATVLIPYAFFAFLIAGHAAYTILNSVFSLKNHPKERNSINQDIKRALNFY
jgi:hypothetical protein